MEKVLLFGATGHLGKEIAKELARQGYELTAVVRNQQKARELSCITSWIVVADVTEKMALKNSCVGMDIVVSALGKSVSLNDKSKPTFYDIDFIANSNILEEARKSGVKKFLYISALHSEKYTHLNYFKVHHEFSEKLKQSGINFVIIKPPAIFSAFIDVIDMAKKGQLMNIGAGDKKTNPIYEGDLAKVAVDALKKDNAIVEAGGKNTYTRKQLNEIIQNEVKPSKKVRTLPAGLVGLSLPLIKLVDKNMYDKFAFYMEVMKDDVLAPPVGEMNFKDYIKNKMN